ncbi:breast cancer type 1 susceptibility protein isoform X2 [Varanus komodoensis]|uniref:breast cancer type 1 susceptibility protein isoform X2 n=1 Tax=Varanus komodoensis TaxID=61221 RepID=UPI001CF7E6C9|nr:breast cancer type 1 susceptibility protein isoform X2 [Varanus komodoensis]
MEAMGKEVMDSSISEIHGMLLALQKNLECPICLEVMKEPVSTNCAHIFCRFCALKLLKQRNGVTQCPLCNAKVTKRSLREDVRFKEVIKVVLETVRAYEHDTGLKFSVDHWSSKKSVEIASASVPEQPVIDCKGYRNRVKRVKEGIKGNTNLGKSSHFPPCNRYSLRKKSNSNKDVIFEFGSDSSEDVCKKAGAVRCVGFGSSSLSQAGESCAKNMELPEPSVEDQAPLNKSGAFGFLEEALGSKEDIQGSPENIKVLEDNVVVDKNQGLFFPEPCTGQHARKPNDSSTHKDDFRFVPSILQLVDETTMSLADGLAENGTGNAGIVLPGGNTQNLCEDEEHLLHCPTSHDNSLSQVPGKKLKRSIQKVSEWLSKSKGSLSSSSLQEVLTEEVNQDPVTYLSDADSCVSEKTEQVEDQGEFIMRRKESKFLSKPVATKIEDKIFGKIYKRDRRSNPRWNEKEIIQLQEEEDTALNTKSCDTPIRKIFTRKRKAHDSIRRQDMKESSKRPGGDENFPLEACDQALTLIDHVLVADQKGTELSTVLVKEGTSIFQDDASEHDQSGCHKLSESNLKNPEKKISSLSKRSKLLSRSLGAVQVVRDISSKSPKKSMRQIDDEESREGGTGQVQVRQSRRLQLITEGAWKRDTGLQLQPEGAWRKSEPAKSEQKEVIEGGKKQGWPQAENTPSPSVAEDKLNMLQGGMQKDISLSDDSLIDKESDANKARINPESSASMMRSIKGLLKNEKTTEGQSPSCIVPSTDSQNSCSLFHPTEVKQTSFVDKHEQNALGTQAPEGDIFFTGDVTETCKHTETDDKATGTSELNPEIDDSELDSGFMQKIVGRCKRQSFLLHQSPVKESAADIQRELTVGKMESNKAHCLNKSGENIDWISEKRREASICEVSRGSSGQRLASCTSHFPQQNNTTENLKLLSQAAFPSHPSMSEHSASKNIENGSQIQSQKPATEKKLSPEIMQETASPSGSSRIPSVCRNSNLQGTTLTLVNTRSPSTHNLQQAGFEGTEIKGLALNSQPELLQSQPTLPELSCVFIEKKSSMKEKQLNSGIGEATDISSPDVPKCLLPSENVEQFTEEESDDLETPEGLLGPSIKNKESSPNLWEMDKKDSLDMSAKTDRDSNTGSSFKLKSNISARKRRVRKLPSSEEEDSSEDELPCFQELIFGKTISMPSQQERNPSTEMLAWKSSSQSNLKYNDGDDSPSQESDCSVNLFSSQTHASADFSSKPHDSGHLTQVNSRENLPSLSRNKEEPIGEENMDYDSEASHMGDSSGLSSQNEILSTQQRDAMKINLDKLQQKMAILEAVLKQGSHSTAPEGWMLPDKEADFLEEQTRSPKGHKAKMSAKFKKPLQGVVSPTVQSLFWTPGSYSTTSSKPEEQISTCLDEERTKGSPAAKYDAGKSSAPRHETHRRPDSPLSPITCCSSSKGNCKSLFLASKRNMFLVASGLNQGELRLVQKFARKTESTWSNNITAETTHVVMKTDEDLVCERTLKYFLGIAAQKWVVSYKWIEQSLKAGKLLYEGDFEVRGDVINGRHHQGPKRARESPAGKLFQGLKICCYEPFTDMLPEQLEWMVELCGASLVKQSHLLACPANSAAVVVVQPDAWVEGSACQGFPLECSATIVSREWVLDSVACYQRQPFDEYIVEQK